MNQLKPCQRELVALGAALGSNCVPCIEYHVPEARKAGLTVAQISEAIGLADKVRRVPAGKVLDVATRMMREAEAAEAAEATPGGEQPQSAASAESPCCAS